LLGKIKLFFDVYSKKNLICIDLYRELDINELSQFDELIV